jgi:hypothetical protein
VLHDIADEAARDSLGTLLLVAGKGVEVQWLDGRRVVALIGPCDLALDPEKVE